MSIFVVVFLVSYIYRILLFFCFCFCEQLTSVIVNINPNDTHKGLSVISLPTEMLKITSSDGKVLEVSSCTLQFKVQMIGKSTQNGHLDRDVEPSLENLSFESEFELFNKNQNQLIESGERELNFFYKNINMSILSLPKSTMWKLKHFVKKSLSMSALNDDEDEKDLIKPAKLKFNLKWSREIKFANDDDKENGFVVNGANCKKRRVFTRSRSTGSIILNRRSFGLSKSTDHLQCLVYQFIHKNYRQKTEIWGCLKCPWCSLGATNSYNLLKHLTLCHDRFKFKYVPGTNEVRIDVFVNKYPNELKYDPFSRHATKFRGREPHKRKTFTGLLVCRPERARPKLSEFLCFDTNLNGCRRNFFHSYSGLPLHSNEIDIDSENEDPLWLQQNTNRMIDEFVDVNDGEKEIMKLWNLHVLKHSFVCDTQMPLAIFSFIETHGEHILANNLYRNCIIHLSNLYDYELINASDQFKAIQILQRSLIRSSELKNVFKKRYQEQYEYTVSKQNINSVEIFTTPKQKRSSLCVYSSMRKRLRSHSRSDFMPRIELQGTDAMETKKRPLITSTPRAVRKSAKITN